jgi:hypothetical protein
VVRPKQDVSFGDPFCRGAHRLALRFIHKVYRTGPENIRNDTAMDAIKAIFIKTEGSNSPTPCGRNIRGDWPMQNIQKYDPKK